MKMQNTQAEVPGGLSVRRARMLLRVGLYASLFVLPTAMLALFIVGVYLNWFQSLYPQFHLGALALFAVWFFRVLYRAQNQDLMRYAGQLRERLESAPLTLEERRQLRWLQVLPRFEIFFSPMAFA